MRLAYLLTDEERDTINEALKIAADHLTTKRIFEKVTKNANVTDEQRAETCAALQTDIDRFNALHLQS